TDGMCHISELADGYVKSVTDEVKVGDVVKVKVIDVDEATGKIRLSRRAVMAAKESPAEPVEAS
ncbi:MAG: S1 RNA-binding domain-containing protein, partial [Planctomycetota bacterium]